MADTIEASAALIGELHQKTLNSLARKTNQTAKELFNEMKGIKRSGELDFDFFFNSVLTLMQENKRIMILPSSDKGREEALVFLVSQ